MPKGHTQGPWEVNETMNETKRILGRCVDFISNDKPGNVCIAEMSNGTLEDAKLIAAAPELLAAIQGLVCCPAFTGKLFTKDKESHLAWTLGRQAITKAIEGY